ncbi:Transcription factor DYT1 [Linum grandiflorum]
MEFVATNMTEPQISRKRTAAKASRHGGTQHHYADDEAKGYKSKNLIAERKRRQKLTDRLHLLRASVPIITNMNKATIIDDAITYIQELMRNVKLLSDQLDELSDLEQGCGSSGMIPEPADENHVWDIHIQEEVEVMEIDGKKLWVKVVMEKRRGRFTRLIEAMTRLGIQPIHTSLTTFNGVLLLSSCVQVKYIFLDIAVLEITSIIV